jgi:hypothetical protein
MDTNVTLGTHYMKMVLDSLDNHPVLASAAYNAGPGRARKWRAERPLEGAIYAETIPFSETRDYVKKVMSNAVYYNTLFEGRPQSLKGRLGTIRARGQGENEVENCHEKHPRHRRHRVFGLRHRARTGAPSRQRRLLLHAADAARGGRQAPHRAAHGPRRAMRRA